MTDKSADTARRSVLKRGICMLAAGASIAASRAMAAPAADAAPEKVAKELVQYQATPKDGNQCSKCAQFQAPNGCAIVAGSIAPTGWCIAYGPKEG